MRIVFLLLWNVVSIFAFDAFISAKDLNLILADKNLVLIDVGTPEAFLDEHIPGAQLIKMSSLRKKIKKHQLMRNSNELEKLFQSIGINEDSFVVIYGHNGKKESLKSSYTALALITMGFDNVTILDGGFAQWEKDFKYPTSDEQTLVRKGNFIVKKRKNILVDMAYVKDRLSKVPMLEARPSKYYYGTEQSSGVAKIGHIPGGMSSFWKDKFKADNTIQSKTILEEIFFAGFGLEKEEEVILYCTGGLEASMNWYILHQQMHFTSAKMYDGSMREWGNTKDTKMTRYKWEVFSK